MCDLSPMEHFMSVLHSFKEKKTLSRAKIIHTNICSFGLETHLDFGKHLLLMFVECGSVSEAQQVFYKLPYEDEDHWTFLIQGYIQTENSEYAFMLFLDMQRQLVEPNAHTFVALLRACVKLKSLTRGQELHAKIARQGFEKDLFVGSVLVDMYAKCNSLTAAQDVFDELPERNVVSWTALMAGYADQGHDEEVLCLLEQMQVEGVCPDLITFACSLKACTSSRVFDKGQRIHARILREGLEKIDVVSNGLIMMYAKNHRLQEACNLFTHLPVRNVVMWTSLMAGYFECGLEEKALDCLEEMKMDGVCPDCVTLVYGLKACSNIGAISRGRELHAEIVREEHDRDVRIGNAIMDMYAKFSLISEARDVFEELQVSGWGTAIDYGAGEVSIKFEKMQQKMSPDVVSWTTVILGYAEDQETEEALELFASMLEQGILPNYVTYVSVLKACSSLAALHAGRVIDARSYKVCGFNSTLATALVDMYSKCGSMADAQKIFDAMFPRDHVAWNALISGYACQGEIERVMSLVERMRMEGLGPDEAAVLSVLTVCSHLGLIRTGQKYLEVVTTEYGIFPTGKQLNCMIDLLCRAGCLNESLDIAEKMAVRLDLVTWGIILSAHQNWADIEPG